MSDYTTMGCWTSSLAHTQILIPPYSPPKQYKLSEKHLNHPSTPTAATCTLYVQGTAFYKYGIDDSLEKNGGTYKSVVDARIDLDNKVHPLFSEHNLRCARREVILPSLRLATLFLDTPCLMNYWYAAFFSLEDVPYADANDARKTFKAIVIKNEPLSAKDVARVRLKLCALAQHVRFYIDCTGGSNGTCEPDEARINPASSVFSGQQCFIRLSTALYSELCDLHDSAFTGVPTAGHHQLAINICHEITHAIHCTRFGSRTAIGCGHQPCSEEGFDWEAATFGGRVVKLNAMNLVIYPWPAASAFEFYMSRLGGGEMFVQAAPVGNVEIAWSASESYLTKLFSKSFWEELMANPDPDALKFPRTLGYRWMPAAPLNACKCVNCRLADGVSEWSIRCGNIDKDKSESANSEWDKLEADVANEYPGWENEELSELPCERHDWGFWPAGAWYTRQYGRDGGFYPQTYGVPDGYKSLPDGTIIAQRRYEELERYERGQMSMNTRIAELALKILAERMEGESEEDKKETARDMRLLSQILESEGVESRYMLCALFPTIDCFEEAQEAFWAEEDESDDDDNDDEDSDEEDSDD